LGIDRGDYWQIAYVIPKGGHDAVVALGLNAFRAQVAALAPGWRTGSIRARDQGKQDTDHREARQPVSRIGEESNMSTANSRRWAGMLAMVSGIVGIVYFPLHATAYFATADGAQELGNPWVSAWSGAFRNIASPLLTFAPADAVYRTYGKVVLFVVLGFLAGLVALHGHQASVAGGVERWGFFIAFAGNLVMAAGVFGEYYTSALSFSFLFLSLPGIFLYMIGISLFGVGTLRAGTTPRLGAWLLILGGLPGIPLLTYLVVGHFSGGLLLLDIAWIIVGYALWSGGRASVPAVQPAPNRP
jgi:hypothetical protein